MNARVIENKAAVLSKIRTIISVEDYGPYFHRLEMVSLVLKGIPVADLVAVGAGSKSSITSWVKIAVEQGPEHLAPKAIPGRPSRLSADQLAELREDLSGSAGKYGFDLWEGKTLSMHIKKKYDIDLKTRQCQYLMHDLGFSLQRPRTVPAGKVSEEEHDEFKKN